MLAALSSDSDSPPRKRMRKGTHSCLECRRRKVRCVFEPNLQGCNERTSREIECTQQELRGTKSYALEKKSTRQRVRELEGILGQILQRLPTKAGALSPGESELGTAEALKSLRSELESSTVQATDIVANGPANWASITPERSDASSNLSHVFEDAPLLSLFDNGILNRTDGCRAESGALGGRTDGRTDGHLLDEKAHRILKALKTLAPNVKDLALILRFGQNSLGLWHGTFPDDLGPRLDGSEDSQIEILRDYIYKSLNSENVAIVAKIMLCLAIHIQQLPSNFDIAQTSLPAPSEALQDRYITSIEALLESDEGFAGTLDGLECMMLQSEFYINVSNARKVWLIIRRAISFAHLLGLHHELDDVGDKLALRRRTLWLHLWQRDRELSLVLGLPYAISDSHFSITTVKNDDSGPWTEKHLLRDLPIAMGHIIDRNQDRSKMTYSVTLKIDQELEDCRKIMSVSWWETLPGPHMSLDAICTMFVAKMMFYNVRKLLHLPYMLKSYTDHRYDSSRIVALECSREVIKVFQVLRDEKRSVLKMCDMVDFQVFCAAMILVLDLLGHSRSPAHHDPYQEERDWEIVYGITQDLKRISHSMICSVATQAARLLEDFYNARHGYSASGEDTYEVDIPYFGKVRIRRDQRFAPWRRSALTSQLDSQLQTPQEVTENTFESSVDPLVSIDSYFHSLPGAFQPWQGVETDWASMFDLSVGDDWSWFPNGTEPQGGR